MVFQQNLLESAYFIAKMPGLAMVRPASSVLWKAPWVTDVSPCETSPVAKSKEKRMFSQTISSEIV